MQLVTDLSLTYRETNWSLKTDQLHLPDGAVSLRGPNMSGKTSLIRVLTGTVPDNCVAQGTLITDDTNHELPLSRDTARQLGINAVHQEDSMFADLSIHDNLRIGTEDDIVHGAVAEPVFRFLNVAPEEPLGTLSGGGKAVIRVARALQEPYEVLFLDEPTANLDEHHKAFIFELLQDGWRDGTTHVLVSHDTTDHERLLGLAKSKAKQHMHWRVQPGPEGATVIHGTG